MKVGMDSIMASYFALFEVINHTFGKSCLCLSVSQRNFVNHFTYICVKFKSLGQNHCVTTIFELKTCVVPLMSYIHCVSGCVHLSFNFCCSTEAGA